MREFQEKKSWIWRSRVLPLFGIAVALFVLAPFPGLGMGFLIRDNLRGHPQARHGSQPHRLVGLWVRDKVALYDFIGQGFYLTSAGDFVTMPSMTRRRWHFDQNTLFVDSVSMCGNCYRGNVTSAYTIQQVDPDELFIKNKDQHETKGVGGRYFRTEVNSELKAKLERLKLSNDEKESMKARTLLMVIEHFEWRSHQEQ